MRITTSSGFTLIPRVSSSKNLRRPALAAGMGAFLSLFFSLLVIMTPSGVCSIPSGVPLIKVVFVKGFIFLGGDMLVRWLHVLRS